MGKSERKDGCDVVKIHSVNKKIMSKEKIYKLVIHSFKYILSKEYRELSRIKQLKRYSSFTTNILGIEMLGVDGPSFVFMYNEILKKRIYNFSASSNSPLIIDCGANIGLSVIFFKKMYPDASIIAFEPDQNIFKTLLLNISSFNLKNITPLNNAAWIKEESLDFNFEGADGGRISMLTSETSKKKVRALRLRDFLQDKKVDFLKMDIEGAETIVLKDCHDLLENIQCLFVEYHSFKDKQQTLQELLSVLEIAGFRYYIESVGVSSNMPFITINTEVGMDIQLNIYAYRR